MPAAERALGVVDDHHRSRVVLVAPRPQILELAREPLSATGLAVRLGLPRQRVNYHVRQLAKAGFLRRAGRRQRRGLQEQLWQATARAFVLTPGLLGPDATAELQPAANAAAGPAALLLLASRLQHELAAASRAAATDGATVPVFAIDADITFASPDQRAAFAAAMSKAVAEVVARHCEPTEPARPRSRVRLQRFRLLVGCHPIATVLP